MITQEIIDAVKNIGKSIDWEKKVDKMSEQQILAIYLRLKNEKKL